MTSEEGTSGLLTILDLLLDTVGLPFVLGFSVCCARLSSSNMASQKVYDKPGK